METKPKIVTMDYDGRILRRHRSAWAAWEYAIRPKNLINHHSQAYYNGKLLRQGTTADIVRGKIKIEQLPNGHNHRVLPDGSVATKCVDGHEEITRLNDDGQILGHYELLYTGPKKRTDLIPATPGK